jgi:hypothetical protein
VSLALLFAIAALLVALGAAAGVLLVLLRAPADSPHSPPQHATDPAPPAPEALARRIDALAEDLPALRGEIRASRAEAALRLEALERALRAAPDPAPPAPPPPAAPSEPTPSARERLAARLQDEGWSEVALEAATADAWTVTAVRRGIRARGIGTVSADGRVDLRLQPTIRAFP